MPRNAQWRALQLYGRSFYQVRKESGFSEWGFLANLPRNISSDSLHDAVIETPFQWQVLAIAYFSGSNGSLMRGWCEVTSQQAFKARGHALVAVMGEALQAAKNQGDQQDLYESALIIRPFTRQRVKIEPILQRYQDTLSLTDEEVRAYSYAW
ncbi:hypothetical protein [Vreelandella alkaliphila]|uniref:Uncharacterized protein n=1 Tax=Vreelandella alkaliphila TaxID=272774 RepID=A0AAJ2RXM0_9GAMM|nr:hypothetical protein [Halomonas alkaliphila]MDX5979626.1 hypothetical protein [Halomonas alkaliphila]